MNEECKSFIVPYVISIIVLVFAFGWLLDCTGCSKQHDNDTSDTVGQIKGEYQSTKREVESGQRHIENAEDNISKAVESVGRSEESAIESAGRIDQLQALIEECGNLVDESKRIMREIDEANRASREGKAEN